LMADVNEFGGNSIADHAGAEHCDFHSVRDISNYGDSGK
jgi:hypothetical protein